VGSGAIVDWVNGYPIERGNQQYTDITIDGTLYVPSGTVLRATGNVVIRGTLDVATGAADNGSYRPLPGVAAAAAGNPGGGIGLGATQAMHLTHGLMWGGGAGARNAYNTGGEGGGALAIYALGSITIASGGAIHADGASATNLSISGQGIPGGGGGAGGVVVLLSKGRITIAGLVTANGGNGADGFDGNGGTAEGGGGGGGGGVVNELAPSTTLSGSIRVNPGAAGANAGTGSSINPGGGGGACGGYGGTGGATGISPAAGTIGFGLTTFLSNPENLAL
jgi:hypothetical protein